MTSLARLAADIEAEDLRQRIAAMEADQAAGLVPPDVTRPLFDHELVARTNFAEVDDEITQAAEILARRAKTDRARILSLLDADLRGTALRPGPASQLHRIALRLFDLDRDGIGLLAGADQVLADAERWHRGRLELAAGTAARRVIAEAKAQGLPLISDEIAVKLDELQADQLDLLARRIAQAPHVDLLRALRDQVVAEEKDFVTADELVDRLITHAQGLSENPLGDVARTGVQQADAMGRVAAAQAIPTPKAIYASELLDRRTCGPCSLVDGKAYDTIADARRDYPNGTYRLCEGGIRCRGTLVFVWPTEADPTLQTPGDHPGLPAADAGDMDPDHPASHVRVPNPVGGTPDAQRTAREAARTLALIGTLHEVPAGAGTIPVFLDPDLGTRSRFPANGEHAPRDGRSAWIKVWTRAPDPGLVMAHEFGHYLDLEALGTVGGGGYATLAGHLNHVLDVISQSPQVARFRRWAEQDPTKAGVINGYWLSPKELWARAYAQWVAERTGDRALRSAVTRAAAAGPHQWLDDDFAPIGHAIDSALAQLGFET